MNSEIPTHFKDEECVRAISAPEPIEDPLSVSFFHPSASVCPAVWFLQATGNFWESQEKLTCRDVGHEACTPLLPDLEGVPFVCLLAAEQSS